MVYSKSFAGMGILNVTNSILVDNKDIIAIDESTGNLNILANCNWWGTNSPKIDKLTLSNWVVLTATSNFTESLKAGEVIGITAGLNTLRDAAGNNYTLGDTDIFDGWNVEINGEKATVKDGKATVLYT